MTRLSTAPQRTATRALALAVCLAAGVALAAPASAAPGFTFDQRVAGNDRVGTAVAASVRAFPSGAGAIVLVNGTRTVDGLTASYVAGLHDAPILYTDAGAVPGATAAEMTRLGTRDVVLVGGEGVLTPGLADALGSQGFHVTRIGGADRYATAALAAGSGPTAPGEVYLASGLSCADALVVGPLAYARHHPVLLTTPTAVPEATSRALAALDAPTRTVVGGEAVVTPDTATALGATRRLAGTDRQATAVEVARHATAEEHFTTDSVGLVGGEDRNAVDALVAASVAGPAGVPLLFTRGTSVGSSTGSYLRARSAELTGTGYVFGGFAAVARSAVDVATAAAANATSPDFPTDPGGAVALDLAGGPAPRRYTVTGLDPSATYDIALFPPGVVTSYASGGLIFADGDRDDSADGLGQTSAGLGSVNGAATAPGVRLVTGVQPQGGAITYTVASTVATSAVPVLWQDTVPDGALDLVRPTTANTQAKGSAEPFAIGGATTWR